MKPIYYLDSENNVCGPVSEEQLKDLHLSHAITALTQVCREGDSEWVPYHKAAGTWEKEEKNHKNIPQKNDNSIPQKDVLYSKPFWAKWGVGIAGVLIVIGLAVWIVPTMVAHMKMSAMREQLSSKKSAMREKLAPTIKCMTTVDLAIQRGVNNAEFRQLVLAAKTEYEILDKNQLEAV